jgi:hypothetical protein
MPATPPPSLAALAKYPKMTAWFNPGLLAKLLWRVIVSDLFGQYADRRLIGGRVGYRFQRRTCQKGETIRTGRGQ